MFASLSASVALADDFKTATGKEYKNATVSRVEADGTRLKRESRRYISRNYPKTFRNAFSVIPGKVRISPATNRIQ
jgi:hypothetical protein